MSDTQTTQATADANSAFAKSLNEAVRETIRKATDAAATAEAPKSINWKGVGKTVAIALSGAATGAAGMWAFKKYFG